MARDKVPLTVGRPERFRAASEVRRRFRRAPDQHGDLRQGSDGQERPRLPVPGLPPSDARDRPEPSEEAGSVGVDRERCAVVPLEAAVPTRDDRPALRRRGARGSDAGAASAAMPRGQGRFRGRSFVTIYSAGSPVPGEGARLRIGCGSRRDLPRSATMRGAFGRAFDHAPPSGRMTRRVPAWRHARPHDRRRRPRGDRAGRHPPGPRGGPGQVPRQARGAHPAAPLAARACRPPTVRSWGARPTWRRRRSSRSSRGGGRSWRASSGGLGWPPIGPI